MGRSIQQFLDDCSSIRGHLKTTWETDPASGQHVAGVSMEDGRKIIDGYACGNSKCLADYGGVYRVVCPICGFDRRASSPDRFMVPVPMEWEAHLRARREVEDGPARRTGQRLPTIEDAFLGLKNNPDVENVSLKKLGPPKWGRGRQK